MSDKLRESCVCGSVIEYEGQSPITMQDNFLLAHADCRDAYVGMVTSPRTLVFPSPSSLTAEEAESLRSQWVHETREGT